MHLSHNINNIYQYKLQKVTAKQIDHRRQESSTLYQNLNPIYLSSELLRF